MHISVCGRDALHCSYGAVVEMSDSRIMHAKRFGIAATTKGRAQIAGTVVDSSLHSGIAALTSEDTTPELSESSSSIKQPMHAGLPAGHVVAKKCSVRANMMQFFTLCDKNKGRYFNHLQVLNSGQYGAFTEGGKIVCAAVFCTISHFYSWRRAGMFPVLECSRPAGCKES